MKLEEVLKYLDEIAPFKLQEEYDNSGLQIGDMKSEVSSALLALDCTEEVLDEAIKLSSNLLIVHHPLLFKGVKSVGNTSELDRIIRKAIKNDIAIIAIHTNLDNVIHGVNKKIADVLQLDKVKILSSKTNTLRKLSFYCPKSETEKVKKAIFKAGAGNVGNYSECSFTSEGVGSFKPNSDSNPVYGEKNKLELIEEDRIEVLLPSYLESKVVSALIHSHPYEEVAYDIFPILNQNKEVGSGMIGMLDEETDFNDFLNQVKKKFKANGIRYTKPHKEKVKKIGLCGGSGSFLLKDAINQNADVFISADFKYHQFFEAEGKIVILDIGHYETEQYTPELLQELLSEKIPNFVTHLSRTNTNPIIYI